MLHTYIEKVTEIKCQNGSKLLLQVKSCNITYNFNMCDTLDYNIIQYNIIHIMLYTHTYICMYVQIYYTIRNFLAVALCFGDSHLVFLLCIAER